MVRDNASQYLNNGKKIPDYVLTTLNNEYSKFCIAKCNECTKVQSVQNPRYIDVTLNAYTSA